MDNTSCLEAWVLSRVTVHMSEVKVLWATIDTRPFFTFILKTQRVAIDSSCGHEQRAAQMFFLIT